MVNLFFRPYVPGFRAKPLDDVPGFAVDEGDELPAGPATPTPAPLIGLPAIRAGSPDHWLALNFNDGEAPGQDTWQPDGWQPDGTGSEPQAWAYPDGRHPAPLWQPPEEPFPPAPLPSRDWLPP